MMPLVKRSNELKKVYDNVKSFKTTNLVEDTNGLMVEGLITFTSGKERKTTFNFTESKKLKSGKVILEGYNNTFSKSKKAFSLKGSIEDKKFVSESLGYHYITKNLNESIRVNGKVKRVLI